jgi:alpha-galactosidase
MERRDGRLWSPLSGPKRLGLRPGHPFVFRLPVDADVAETVRVDRLPDGLCLQGPSAVIAGTTAALGTHRVTVRGHDDDGAWTDAFEIVVGETICLTPPLGWNSWNVFGADVTEDHIRAAATALVESGLAARGWSTVNIDDGWQGARDRRGRLRANEKFPDLGRLCDDLHDLGLRVGIYSSPGPTTCAGFTGSAGFEEEDARSFGDWGFDYLKYDWCSTGPIDHSTPLDVLAEPYARMRAALDRVPRDIVYHVCQYGYGRVWEWARDRVGANAWRTTGDIDDSWASVERIGFGQAEMASFAGPGGWNDPDMLVLGAVGGAWGRPIRQTGLTPDEQRSHYVLWVLLAAPLLLGCDLTLLDAVTLELVGDRELLDVHQDPLGQAASPVRVDGGVEVWRRPLADGSVALGAFNRGGSPVSVGFEWRSIGLRPSRVRDLLASEWLDTPGGWQADLPAHGCAVVRAW